MKVRKISLSNFRGFTQMDLTFGPQITVLAGVNGSGKSGILRALATLLSHLLRHEGPSKETPASLTAGDVQAGKRTLTLSASFEEGKRTLHAQVTRSIPDPTKAPEYAKRRDAARAALRYTKGNPAEEKDLNEEIRYLSELLEAGRDSFTHQVETPQFVRRGPDGMHPMAVFYATSRYFRGAGTRPLRVEAFEPSSACSEAFEGAPVSLYECASWFYAAHEGKIGTKANSKRLLAYVNTVVETLLPGFSKLRIEPSPARVFVKKGDTEFELGQLSDGERGLLALAFDLTRRLAIANPSLKAPVAEGEAIVLLDEIELHLHPSWQRKVLDRLLKTFKKCQFIATTHSPQVLGEAPPDTVWMMEREDGQVMAWQPDRVFGMDSNRLLEELMGTDSINASVKNKIHEIGVLVDKEEFQKAEAAITGLEAKLGEDHPELIRLRALIAFLTRKK
jgi:predicted ATPase